MGEMADMYDECPYDFDRPYERHDDFRKEIWYAKKGKCAIEEMTDIHLLAAYKLTGYELLRDEMLIRLFEDKLRNTT
jgi:hypothetical protein